MTVLTITNPRSRKAGGRLPALLAALPESPDLQHIVTRDSAELGAIFSARRWQPDDVLVINGGDGTTQRALTELANRCEAQRWPRVAVLPSGTTNMTAFDFNGHRGFRRCLEALGAALREPRSAPQRQRHLVTVELPGQRLSGLFFGTGTIVQGIEYFHARVNPAGGGHELGAGIALLRTLWGISRRQPPFADALSLSLDAPTLRDAARGLGTAAAPDCALAVRLFLVTGLERLFLGLRPYWHDSPDALRATLIEARAPRFLRSMPRLLRGRPDALMSAQQGYHSSAVCELRLRFDGPFTLDGELFACRGDTIAVRRSPALRILSL
ncbi:MAG: diacylglycerol kinase family protein [Pseudomonadales bacterium]